MVSVTGDSDPVTSSTALTAYISDPPPPPSGEIPTSTTVSSRTDLAAPLSSFFSSTLSPPSPPLSSSLLPAGAAAAPSPPPSSDNSSNLTLLHNLLTSFNLQPHDFLSLLSSSSSSRLSDLGTTNAAVPPLVAGASHPSNPSQGLPSLFSPHSSRHPPSLPNPSHHQNLNIHHPTLSLLYPAAAAAAPLPPHVGLVPNTSSPFPSSLPSFPHAVIPPPYAETAASPSILPPLLLPHPSTSSNPNPFPLNPHSLQNQSPYYSQLQNLTSSSPPTFSPPLISTKLNSDNYSLWKYQFELILGSNDLLGYVDGTLSCPPFQILPNGHLVTNPSYNLWLRTDRSIRSWMNATFTTSIIQEVHTL